MKKIAAVLLVIILAVGLLVAGDVKFLFTELDQHPEIVVGFLPTLTTVGVSYEGVQLSPGDLTQFQATFGGGYTQRRLFQNPTTGAPIYEDLFIWDAIQTRWNLRMMQGFGQSWVPNKDLITVYAGYEGRWEKNVDSMVAGEYRLNGLPGSSTDPDDSTLSEVQTFDNWWDIGALSTSTVFPDLANDGEILSTALYTGIKFNYMEDTMVAVEGAHASLDIHYTPSFLNQEASFYSITANAVAGTTLLELKNNNGTNNLSFVVIDRVNFNWTDGDQVPTYAQKSVSLGRKMRGFSSWNYNTQFTAVNNFDFRIAGPEPFIDGVFPRINLFFDMGYHAGKYFNSDITGTHFLMSTGAQFTVSFFDFIDLGYQVSYLIMGENVQQPGEDIITSFTFFLDF